MAKKKKHQLIPQPSAVFVQRAPGLKEWVSQGHAAPRAESWGAAVPLSHLRSDPLPQHGCVFFVVPVKPVNSFQKIWQSAMPKA